MISRARSGRILRPSRRMSRRVRPGDVLHHDVGLGDVAAVGRHLLAGVVDRDDRGVVQRGGRLRLAAEPGLEGGVAGEVGAQPLDRDGAAEAHVGALADLGHAAAPEQLAHLVASADPLRFRHRRLSLPSCPCWAGVRRSRPPGAGLPLAPLPLPLPLPVAAAVAGVVARCRGCRRGGRARLGLRRLGLRRALGLLGLVGRLAPDVEGDGRARVDRRRWGRGRRPCRRRGRRGCRPRGSWSSGPWRPARPRPARPGRRCSRPRGPSTVSWPGASSRRSGGARRSTGGQISEAPARTTRTSAAGGVPAASGCRSSVVATRGRRLGDRCGLARVAGGARRRVRRRRSTWVDAGQAGTAAAPAASPASRRAAAKRGAVGVAVGGVLRQRPAYDGAPGRRARGRAAAGPRRGCGPARSRPGCRPRTGACPVEALEEHHAERVDVAGRRSPCSPRACSGER